MPNGLKNDAELPRGSPCALRERECERCDDEGSGTPSPKSDAPDARGEERFSRDEWWWCLEDEDLRVRCEVVDPTSEAPSNQPIAREFGLGLRLKLLRGKGVRASLSGAWRYSYSYDAI